MAFGERFRIYREGKKISMLKMCREAGVDQGNWSKVEREIIGPPRDMELLGRICDAVGANPRARAQIIGNAVLSRRELPKEIMSDPEMQDLLPEFFGAVVQAKPWQLRKMLEWLTKPQVQDEWDQSVPDD